MMRFLIFIFQIALLAAVALWLADRPGSAQIVWHDTVIETSAAFLALCVLFLAFAFYLLFRLWHLLRHGPAHWRMRRQVRKMRQGQEQLTKGLIAIAGGNAVEAGRLAVASRKNVGYGTASLWLQAQAAQLAGDRISAREIFRQLAADPDACVLGYRGLITEAKRAGKWDEVDRLLGELHARKPATPWLSLIRMESAARRRQWGEAEAALSNAVAARLLDSSAGRRTRAALRIAVSRAALMRGDKQGGLDAAEQAARQAPGWLPAIINLAELLAAAEHHRAAIRLIERSWKQNPHPQLAAILRRLFPEPLNALRQTEAMCNPNPAAQESRLALAEAALAADIWGEARRHLLAGVADGGATQNTYRMLARLERRQHGDEAAATGWLARAADAKQDPAWLCRSCGGAHTEWHPVCSHCSAFDTLEWQSAGQRSGMLSYTSLQDE